MVQDQHGVRQRWLVASDDMDGEFLSNLRPLRLRLNGHQAHPGVYLGSRRHRTHEAQLVGAIVGGIAIAHDLELSSRAQHRDQTEREEAVRDGLLERALALAALDVHVNPLMVARQLGELVDHLLGDLGLGSEWTERVTHLRAQLLDVIEADVLHVNASLAVAFSSAASHSDGNPENVAPYLVRG